MVITQLETVKRLDAKGSVVAQEENSEELQYSKEHEQVLYKILKYNPFDPINDWIRKIQDKLNLQEKADWLNWWGAFVWCRASMRALWRFRIEGEMFPEYGGGILVGNHQSHLDPFFLAGATHRRIQWMSKEENFKTPIVRSLFTNLGAFKVLRGQADQAAWDKAKSIIQSGEFVGIFPEGTRTEDGSLGEFHTGAVRLAVETGVPIVPLCVIGSREALPKGKLVMKPVRVSVRIGKPIYYDQYKNNFSYPVAKQLSAELRGEIIKLIESKDLKEQKKQESKELSIGSPDSSEKEHKSGGFKGSLKYFGKSTLQLIDDSWYAFIKSLEVFGVNEPFQEAIHHFSAQMVGNYSNIMNPYRAIDYQYIPSPGPAIVCSNHNSEWDVIILATSISQYRKRILYQMAKESLFRTPIVNAWVRTHHAFPLKRGEHDVGSYLYAKDRLEHGHLVCIYPEGTTNEGNGVILPGHTGAMRLAIEAKVPIIPIGITGTEKIFPKHAKMLNFGKGCVLKAGEPFLEHQKYWDAPQLPPYEELQRLTDQLMTKIKSLLLYNDPEA